MEFESEQVQLLYLIFCSQKLMVAYQILLQYLIFDYFNSSCLLINFTS
jgi:hypothetical protein